MNSFSRIPKWREDNPDQYRKSCRESNWRRRGITEIDKANSVRDGATSCEICRLPNENLYLDHCHLTKKVRGMLCQRCNSGLGFFEDNTSYLTQAIFYLDRHS